MPAQTNQTDSPQKIKVLQVNKFFYQEGRGGAVGAFQGLIDLLKDKGHAVQIFSTQSSLNPPSPFEKFFPKPVPISPKDNPSLLEKIKLAGQVIRSKEAAQKLEELFQEDGLPDIAHLHNIAYYLTPSILPVLKKHRIPIIQTLHNYQLICPNYKLFTQGRVCERCKPKKYYNSLLFRCVQDSAPRSLLASLERYWNRSINDYARQVDLFIAPSRFIQKKVIEFGIPKDKVVYLPNYLPFQQLFGETAQGASNKSTSQPPYCLYFGRLAQEKGLGILLQAFPKIKNQDLHLKIVGSGPLEKELKALAQKLKLQDKVEFLDFMPRPQLAPIIKNALATIYPSEWYENAPLAVYESLFLKTPVIAANIGGLPELIKPNVNGLLFKPGSAQDLALKIDQLANQKATSPEREGRSLILNSLSQEDYYNKLLKTYSRVMPCPE